MTWLTAIPLIGPAIESVFNALSRFTVRITQRVRRSAAGDVDAQQKIEIGGVREERGERRKGTEG